MRIVVKSDVPGWAFDRRATAYEKYAPEGWQVTACHNSSEAVPKDCDGLFLLDCTQSRESHPNAKCVKLIGSHAWMYDRDESDYWTLGCNENRNKSKILDHIEGCTVAVYNTNQKRFFESICDNRVVLAPYCVDHSVFNANGRPTGKGRLTVGWNYQISGGLNSFKGLSQILVDVIAIVGDAVDWDVKTPDSGSKMDEQELANWYRGIDIFLCTSFAEGGPQCPFEAAACGAAIISTCVGQVADLRCLKRDSLFVRPPVNANECAFASHAIADRILELNRDRKKLAKCKEAVRSEVESLYNAEKQYPKQLVELFSAD